MAVATGTGLRVIKKSQFPHIAIWKKCLLQDCLGKSEDIYTNSRAMMLRSLALFFRILQDLPIYSFRPTDLICNQSTMEAANPAEPKYLLHHHISKGFVRHIQIYQKIFKKYILE